MREDYNEIFPDEREKYSNDLKGLHYILLRMLKIIDYICQKYKIIYWLDAGTLLGAVRHQGFIPWDDDIDIVMPREEYSKFIKAFNLEQPEGLFLQNKETDKYYKQDFIKIRDLNSKIIENSEVGKEIKYVNGIFLDIFPLDEIKEYNFLKKIGKLIHKLAYLQYYVQIDKKQKFYKNILVFLSKKIGKNKILKLNTLIYMFMKKVGRNDAYIYIEGKEWWNIWNKKEIYPLKKILFENFYFNAPNNLSYYLEELYKRDYMILPDKSKRYNHLKEIVLDIERSSRNEY